MDSNQENYFEKIKNSDKHFYSKNFAFEERGGYFVDLKFSPRNFIYKFLVKMGILKIKRDIYISAINNKEQGDYSYAYIKCTDVACRAILMLEKSEYNVRVTVPSFNLTFFNVDMSVYRMHH